MSTHAHTHSIPPHISMTKHKLYLLLFLLGTHTQYALICTNLPNNNDNNNNSQTPSSLLHPNTLENSNLTQHLKQNHTHTHPFNTPCSIQNRFHVTQSKCFCVMCLCAFARLCYPHTCLHISRWPTNIQQKKWKNWRKNHTIVCIEKVKAAHGIHAEWMPIVMRH